MEPLWAIISILLLLTICVVSLRFHFTDKSENEKNREQKLCAECTSVLEKMGAKAVAFVLSKPIYGNNVPLYIYQSEQNEQAGFHLKLALKLIICKLLGLPQPNGNYERITEVQVKTIILIYPIRADDDDQRLLNRLNYIGVDLKRYWTTPIEIYKKNPTLNFKFLPSP